MADLGSIGFSDYQNTISWYDFLTFDVPWPNLYKPYERFAPNLPATKNSTEELVYFFDISAGQFSIDWNWKGSMQWVVGEGFNRVTLDCQLNAHAATFAILPFIEVEGVVFEGVTGTTDQQTITATYTSDRYKVITLYYGYLNYNQRQRQITWFFDIGTNNAAGGGSTGLAPGTVIIPTDGIPLEYGDITITASTTTTMTLTIAANTVSSTITDIPILLHLHDYFSNANGDIDDIFTQIGNTWLKFYVKDGATNLTVKVEKWDNTENIARVWVEIDSLTTAAKDLTLVFDPAGSDNTLIEEMKVIGT